MALAFVSTKREEARTKGRFGIGLKTLRRLGTTLSVHCGPYHASISGDHVDVAPPAPAIERFYRPGFRQTLLELEPNERASGISSSTSCSRGVSSVSGSSRRRFESTVETMIGSSAEPPSPTRRTASTKSSTLLIRP